MQFYYYTWSDRIYSILILHTSLHPNNCNISSIFIKYEVENRTKNSYSVCKKCIF